jgi:hypothetical protein
MFIADKIGYTPLFLAGCDFAYPDNKERFTEYNPIEWDETGEPVKWEEHKHPLVIEEG